MTSIKSKYDIVGILCHIPDRIDGIKEKGTST